MRFAFTIFLSAFLLFVVQLILGKQILPWFGGAPAVWTTCMLFFMAVLLLGYTYAHVLSARLPPRAQAQVHIGLLTGSVLLLGWQFMAWGSPILPAGAWKPTRPDQPVWQILKLLTVSAGLPFFLLSSTSPLLQRWYSLEPGNRRPYRLYALSNVGSMLGLLAFPFLLEPMIRLRTQGAGWAILYLAFVVGCIGCAAGLLRNRASAVASADSRTAEAGGPRPTWGTVAIWLALTVTTSSMLLSVTNNLCQDVAVVPFLWVVPLALYLLSFILCFDSDRWYSRRWFVIGTAIASIAVLITALNGMQLSIPTHIVAYGLFLFLFCMTCHGELVRLRPGTRHLTLFYLTVALGGALGGVFVGLIAPMIFQSFWEFHVTLLAGWIVLTVVFARDRTSFFYTGDRWQFALLFGVLAYAVLQQVLTYTALRITGPFRTHALITSIAVSAGVALVVLAVTWKRAVSRSKYWPRLLVGTVIFLGGCFMLNRVRSTGMATVDVERNFYGVVRVVRGHVGSQPPLPIFQLTHGQITHGIQFADDSLCRDPVGYYSASSGVALALRHHPARAGEGGDSRSMNIGVMGLGVGTLAAFAREGDRVRFYEINPAVVNYSMAAEPAFTYVKECAGKADVVPGDARLSLERELAEGSAAGFDVLAMDAFSSDSVPVHLLTREAFEIYLQHLRDENSIIAVNISNRFLDLRDLMFSIARHFGLSIVIVHGHGDPPDNTPSRWCLLTRNGRFVELDEVRQAQQVYEPRREILWTDDFSNMFELLK